jgi:hypothetical protein
MCPIASSKFAIEIRGMKDPTPWDGDGGASLATARSDRHGDAVVAQRWDLAIVDETHTLRGGDRRRDGTEWSGLETVDLYRKFGGGWLGWTRLRRDVELLPASPGPSETALAAGVARLLHADDAERLGAWRSVLDASAPPAVSDLDTAMQRRLAMLHFLLWGREGAKLDLAEGFARLWASAGTLHEIRELLALLDDCTTTAESDMGRRYRQHAQLGTQVLLFVRRRETDERGLAVPYVSLPRPRGLRPARGRARGGDHVAAASSGATRVLRGDAARGGARRGFARSPSRSAQSVDPV